MKTWGKPGDAGQVRFDDFVLDTRRRQLTRDGRPLHLTPKAFDLLALLVDEAPRVVPKRELHERLWQDTFVSDATLAGVVKELRRVLEDRSPGRPIIRTAHRVGYAFGLPIERTAAAPDACGRMHWVLVEGRRIVLQPGENVIGRDPGAVVQLDSAAVSRRHARIVIDGDDAQLEDLGSKNGTMLDDCEVAGPVVLKDGQRVTIGPVQLLYRTSTGETTETREQLPTYQGPTSK